MVQEIRPYAAEEGPRPYRSDILEIKMPLSAFVAKAGCMSRKCKYLGNLKMYPGIHYIIL